MKRVIAEISIVPIGTRTPSLSKFIASSLKLLKEKGIKYKLTPMSTIIEAPLKQVLEIARLMHEEVFKSGALRVVTQIKIDDRRDKEISMESKVIAVKRKLKNLSG